MYEPETTAAAEPITNPAKREMKISLRIRQHCPLSASRLSLPPSRRGSTQADCRELPIAVLVPPVLSRSVRNQKIQWCPLRSLATPARDLVHERNNAALQGWPYAHERFHEPQAVRSGDEIVDIR